MSINPLTGLIQWIAEALLPSIPSGSFTWQGGHGWMAGIGAAKANVSIMASDPYGAAATQNFTITVGIGKNPG